MANHLTNPLLFDSPPSTSSSIRPFHCHVGSSSTEEATKGLSFELKKVLCNDILNAGGLEEALLRRITERSPAVYSAVDRKQLSNCFHYWKKNPLFFRDFVERLQSPFRNTHSTPQEFEEDSAYNSNAFFSPTHNQTLSLGVFSSPSHSSVPRPRQFTPYRIVRDMTSHQLSSFLPKEFEGFSPKYIGTFPSSLMNRKH